MDGYLLYLPRTFQKAKSYPVIIFLQGGLGVGGDLPDVGNWGLPKMLRDKELEFKGSHYMQDSFIVIVPHMVSGPFKERQWFLQEEGMATIIKEVDTRYDIDNDRIYLTGLSRGGAGTWGLASRMEGVFAAIAPICGVNNGITDYDNLLDLPIWVAHNTGDQIVDYDQSVEVVDYIEKKTGQSFLRINTPAAYTADYQAAERIFSTFDYDNHDAWTDMYGQQELYIWLLSKNR